MTLVYMTCYHTTMALLIFENLFCLTAAKVVSFVLFCLKLLYLHNFQVCKFHLNYWSPLTIFFMSYNLSNGLRNVQDVGC